MNVDKQRYVGHGVGHLETVYITNDLSQRFKAANDAGLIERGFLSQAVAKAITEKLDQIDAEAERYRAYLDNADQTFEEIK